MITGKKVVYPSQQRRRKAQAAQDKITSQAGILQNLSQVELGDVQAELAQRQADAAAEIARQRHELFIARQPTAEDLERAKREQQAERARLSETVARHRAGDAANSEAYVLGELDRLSAEVKRLSALVEVTK